MPGRPDRRPSANTDPHAKHQERGTVMPHDPYAVLRALLRAEAARRTPRPGTAPQAPGEQRLPARDRRRG
ncbi:hypothetical protein ADL35_39585 [Streptomyces sp. NRRL WC-3753]|nr:hypothetical protein ADL35_39585 [Streptomyces sp. NRRL WC-3753]OWA14182.1 hypothetical protein B9W64_19060 [Streptomyces sp. CS159]